MEVVMVEQMKKGMKVKELIRQLKELNPNGQVVVLLENGLYNVKEVTGNIMLTGDVAVLKLCE